MLRKIDSIFRSVEWIYETHPKGYKEDISKKIWSCYTEYMVTIIILLLT